MTDFILLANYLNHIYHNAHRQIVLVRVFLSTCLRDIAFSPGKSVKMSVCVCVLKVRCWVSV